MGSPANRVPHRDHVGRRPTGFGKANRQAAGAGPGGEVEVEFTADTQPRVVDEPPDFPEALDAGLIVRNAHAGEAESAATGHGSSARRRSLLGHTGRNRSATGAFE